LQITLWFIKISLFDTAEMREILVTRRVSGRWLYNAGVSREMRETWQVCVSYQDYLLTYYCNLKTHQFH